MEKEILFLIKLGAFVPFTFHLLHILGSVCMLGLMLKERMFSFSSSFCVTTIIHIQIIVLENITLNGDK